MNTARGYGWVFFLLLLLVGCYNDRRETLDFSSDPRIFRGDYSGVLDTRSASSVVALSADAGILAMGGSATVAGEVQLFDAVKLRPVRSLGESIDPNERVSAVAISGDGQRVASLRAGKVTLWNALSGRAEKVYTDRSAFGECRRVCLTHLALSQVGNTLAIGGQPIPGTIVIAMFEGGVRRFLLDVPGTALRALELSASGNRLATLSIGIISGKPVLYVRVWDLGVGSILYEFDGARTRQHPQLAFSADGARLAFYAGDEARVLEVASGRELARFDLPKNPGILALDPGGSLLAVTDLGARNTSATWRTGIFSVDDQRFITQLSRVRVKAWSADSERLVTQGNPAAHEGPALLEAETYAALGTFAVGARVTLNLSAESSFVSAREYGVTGSVQFGTDAPQSFTGTVFGNGAQRYERQPFRSSASFHFETAAGWSLRGTQAEDGVWSGETVGLTRWGSRTGRMLELSPE